MPTRQPPQRPRSGPRGGRGGCPRSVLLSLAGTLLLVTACDPSTIPGPDGGARRDANTEVSGRVEVSFHADEEGEVGAESGVLALMDVRARSDRGAAEDPTWRAVTLELGGAPLEADGVPATYGGVLLEPSADEDCAATLRMTVREAHDVVVCLDGWASLDLRCASPVVLAPGGRVRIDAVLRISVLASAFDDEDVEEGARIDSDTHPSIHDALLAAWPTAWAASCEASDETSGDHT